VAKTHIYKTTPNCKIHLDLHRPSNPTGHVIVWIHGGALIGGSREVNPARISHYLDNGYTVFSIDYRLAPETKLPDIIEDVRDALLWVLTNGETVADVDPTRMGVVGHSAGGYLSLMTGTFDTPPNAIVPFYGYGDLIGDWYAKPDEFYRTTQPLVTEEDAFAAVTGPPVTNSDERPGPTKFYLYCRQQGIWPQHIGGWDPSTDAESFHPYCPERNVTEHYPPTLMLHGDKDTDVPYELSVRMASALKDQGITHDLITIDGGGHGFDGRQDDPQVLAAWPRVIAFLKEHV
jgi:acetyl esterase/lipase